MAKTNVCAHTQIHMARFSICLATPLVFQYAVAAAANYCGSSKHPLTCCCKARSTYTNSRACQVLCKQNLQPALDGPSRASAAGQRTSRPLADGALRLKSSAALVLPHLGQTSSLASSGGGCEHLRWRSFFLYACMHGLQ